MRNAFVGDTGRDGALIEWIMPPVALALFGGGPETPPLVKLSAEMGHEAIVVDRRPDFAAATLYPGAVRVLLARPERAAACLQPDLWTAAAVMNHHYESDRDILASLLSLRLGYVGVLGPRRRTERMLDEIGIEPRVPAVFDGIFFPELRSLSGDAGARALLAREAARIAWIAPLFPLADVDTPQDYVGCLNSRPPATPRRLEAHSSGCQGSE